MKGAFAAALAGLQSLKDDNWRERPVDRVGAMGAAQIARAKETEQDTIVCSLGVDLIRYKYAGVERAGPDAEDQLAGILAWPRWWKGWKVVLDEIQRDSVACWAVHEWAQDRCPPRPQGCGGALEVPSAAQPIDGAQPMMTCPRCGGVGKRKWTDEERVEAMGEPFEYGMDRAHWIISVAESMAMRRGKEMLERWP
jgi:hypothetical protein